MTRVAKPTVCIQIATGDKEPNVEWMELRSLNGRRYRYVDRFEAEQVLNGDPVRGIVGLQQRQPHAKFRIHPLP